MSVYLERHVIRQSQKGEELVIADIRAKLATGPVKGNPLAHRNFQWWLQERFPTLAFDYISGLDELAATHKVVDSLDADMPVIVSVSHARTPGHIVLVVGYEGRPAICDDNPFRIVMHDPAGRFDSYFERAVNKYVGAMSVPGGSEYGPGLGCRVPIRSISRRRDVAREQYILLKPYKPYCE